MNIYHLSRLKPAGYDEATGFVVVAASQEDARALAADEHGDEKPSTWIRAENSAISLIGAAVGEPRARVVMRSFKAG